MDIGLLVLGIAYPVAQAVVEILAQPGVLRYLPGGCIHIRGVGSVHRSGFPGQVHLKDQVVEVFFPLRGLPDHHGPRGVGVHSSHGAAVVHNYHGVFPDHSGVPHIVGHGGMLVYRNYSPVAELPSVLLGQPDYLVSHVFLGQTRLYEFQQPLVNFVRHRGGFPEIIHLLRGLYNSGHLQVVLAVFRGYVHIFQYPYQVKGSHGAVYRNFLAYQPLLTESSLHHQGEVLGVVPAVYRHIGPHNVGDLVVVQVVADVENSPVVLHHKGLESLAEHGGGTQQKFHIGPGGHHKCAHPVGAQKLCQFVNQCLVDHICLSLYFRCGTQKHKAGDGSDFFTPKG